MSPTPDLEEALRLKRAGNLDDAVIALEDVLGRSPNDPVALAHLAEVQLRRHRTAEAGAALDRAEGLAGTNAHTAKVRGDLAYREQRWRDAATAYRESSLLGERGIWPLTQLARCHLRLNELDAARGAAAQAAEREPTSAAPWVLLGEIALREGRADAVELLEQAHQRAPGDEYAYAKLIEARLAQLPPDEREREVQVLLASKGQGNRFLQALLARLQTEGGDDRRAAGTWRATREQRGGDPYARKMEAYALRRAGRPDEAAPLFHACLLDDPDDLVMFRTYIHMQRTRGALEELKATLEAMLPVAGRRRGAIYGELRKLETS